MALADHTLYTVGSPTVVLSSTSPIEGTNSLLYTGTANPTTLAQVYTASNGFTRVRIRTAFSIVTGGGSSFLGLYGMTSADDATGGSVSAYTAMYEHSVNTIRIHKVTAGVGSAGTTLASGSFAQTTGHLIFDIIKDYPVVGQVYMVVQGGSSTDFTGSTTLVQHTDTSSPYLVSSSEGIAVRQIVAATRSYRFDRTSVFTFEA